jgi:DNA-binding beta-propeller fold protein YncE
MRRLAGFALLVAAISAFAPTAPAVAAAPSYVATIGGPGHAAIYPSGVDVDAAGNVYVADTGNDKVRKFGPGGALLWSVGTRGLKAPGRYDNPRDIAYLKGRLYVADLGFKRVHVLDATSGAEISIWPVSFPSIIGISAGVDARGNDIILATEDTLNEVRIFTTAGVFVRTIGSGPGSGNGQLNTPRDAATDASGNIYVADYANNRIAKFSPAGVWIKNWGSGGGHPGQFRRPYGIDLDVSNRVYVADATNHRIQIFTKGGTYLNQVGSSGFGSGQFFQLRRVAVTPNSTNPTIYGADLWGYKVERFTPNSSGVYAWTRSYGAVPPPDPLFNEPAGIAVDGSNIFVADSVNQRMQRFDGTTYAWQLHWGQRGWGSDPNGFNWPRDIAIDRVDLGTVWITDTKNGRMLQFTRDGVPTGRKFGTQGSGSGQFNRLNAVAATSSGLLIADTFNDRVQLWNTTATTPFLVWTSTGLLRPKDVAVSNGVVYVADSSHHRIAKLSLLDGHLLGSFGSATLHAPEGVAVEPGGSVWVADTNANRLVEFDAAGAVMRVMGSFGTGHGQFSSPTHIEVVAGRLYVCDTFNDRVEVFSLG